MYWTWAHNCFNTQTHKNLKCLAPFHSRNKLLSQYFISLYWEIAKNIFLKKINRISKPEEVLDIIRQYFLNAPVYTQHLLVCSWLETYKNTEYQAYSKPTDQTLHFNEVPKLITCTLKFEKEWHRSEFMNENDTHSDENVDTHFHINMTGIRNGVLSSGYEGV